MNKTAGSALDPFHFNSVRGYQPADLFLISALTGAGGFGGMRLLSEMLGKVNPPKPKENVVRLAAPNAAETPVEEFGQQQAPEAAMQSSAPLPKTAAINKTANPAMPSSTQPFGGIPGQPQVPVSNSTELLSQVSPDNSSGGMKALALAGGLPAGFLGAKFLYDKYKAYEMDQKIERSRQDYLQQLAQVQEQQSKMAEITSCVDAFCTAVAEELNKVAGIGPAQVDALAGSPLIQNAIDDVQRADLSNSVRAGGNALSMNAGTLLKDTMGVVGAGSLAATLGALMWANKKKREKEEKAQYPMRVVYGP